MAEGNAKDGTAAAKRPGRQGISTPTGDTRRGTADKLLDIALASAWLLRNAREQPRVIVAKGDGSPCTDADTASDLLVRTHLAVLWPDIPIVSEEHVAYVSEALPSCFILVDPLDGTREFVGGSPDFTVNIAVVVDGRPWAACVVAPSRQRAWLAHDTAEELDLTVGAHGFTVGGRRDIHVNCAAESGITAITSLSHAGEACLTLCRNLGVARRVEVGSSLKFCLVARGDAHIYPRTGQTMEWDTAAGDAVVTAAGGVVLALSGSPPLYGQVGQMFRNAPFVAAASPALARRALAQWPA
jgi:3'(2'), 5'-bisphosphate nucleotidase